MPVYAIAESIVSPLGIGASLNYKAILEGKTGISFHNNIHISPSPFYASIVDESVLSDFWTSKPNLSLPDEDWNSLTKLEKMLVAGIYDALIGKEHFIEKDDTAFIFTTTKGNIQLANRGYSDELLLWNTAQKVASIFKHPSEPYTISNACISGLSGIILGKRLIDHGFVQTAIVVGGDLVSEFTFSGFSSFKAISPEPCKPYDKNRLGITLGEGVGVVVLSKNNSDIRICGGATSSDANHISGPSRTGEGLVIAIDAATKEANIALSEINFISLHGTGTSYNDEMEAQGLNRLGLEKVPVHSLKGYFGHTLGAAGLMEAALDIQMMRNGMSIPSFGFSELGTTLPLNVCSSSKAIKIDTLLKTASGFGGCNAAVVFKKVDRLSIAKAEARLKAFSYNLKKEISIRTNEGSIQIKLNGREIYNQKLEGNADDTLNAAFRELCPGYLKFFKMDRLCKLGFLATELLLKDISPLKKFSPEDIGVSISNRSSSLDTDLQYQQSINDKANYFPSPAVFVYTLPNILMGEIAIRHNFKGENLWLTMPHSDADVITEQVDLLFLRTKTKALVFGWVEILGDAFECKLHWAERQ